MYGVHSPWAGCELTTLAMMGTDCTCSCKSNYNTNRTTTAPSIKDESSIPSHVELYSIQHDMAKLIRNLWHTFASQWLRYVSPSYSSLVAFSWNFVIPPHCHLLNSVLYNDTIFSQSAQGNRFISCQNMYIQLTERTQSVHKYSSVVLFGSSSWQCIHVSILCLQFFEVRIQIGFHCRLLYPVKTIILWSRKFGLRRQGWRGRE